MTGRPYKSPWGASRSKETGPVPKRQNIKTIKPGEAMETMKPKTELYICFDTEDYTSSYAADAIRDTARLLESEGIRGNYLLGDGTMFWMH